MRNYFNKLFFITLLICPLAALANPIKLTAIETNPDATRVIIQTSQPVNYHYFQLTKPNRLVIDFPNALLTTSLPKSTDLPSPLTQIRSGLLPNNGTRLVLQFSQHIAVNLYSSTYQLIIELSPTSTTSSSATSSPSHSTFSLSNSPTNLKPVLSQTAMQTTRPAIVVIDAGHGGKDPGAAGPDGIHEKDVVLAIAEDLYDLLSEQPGVKPVMTRSGDYYIPLRGRLQIAREAHGDLFVAIHADAFPDPTAHGASVFALSLHGATSEAARWLAERENYSELDGTNIEDEDNMVRSVLINLSQTATIDDSLQLGGLVLHNLDQLTHLHHPWVEQAPFMVLKSPDIPSILVETGFISNWQEEHKLSTPSYQHLIAQAIMQGIMQYLHTYPPQGTIFDHE